MDINCISTQTDGETSQNTNEKINDKTPKKRTVNPDNWKRNLNRQKRIRGESYQTRKGKWVPAKQFVDIPCGCSRKCNEKITSKERETAMKSFYELKDQLLQNIFLRGSAHVNSVKRRRPRNGSPKLRSRSCSYFLRINNVHVQVCRKYFQNTFQISNQRLDGCVSKKLVTDLIDRRGRHPPANKKIKTND